MPLDKDAGVINSLDDEGCEHITEQALWSAIRIHLQQQGADEGVKYLRDLMSCELVAEDDDAEYVRHRYNIQQNVSVYDARYNVVDKQKMGFMFSALMEDSIQNLSLEQCLGIARREAELPRDAQQVLAEFQELGDEMVFIARWHHFHQGIWVEADYIQVMINSATGKVFGYQRNWHDVNYELSER